MKDKQTEPTVNVDEAFGEELAEEVKVTEEAAEKPEDFLKKEVDRLNGEIKEKDDRFLRMAAEYDNFRRRSREEKESIYDSAVSDTLSSLLPVIDNLERAAQYDDGEKVKEGVQMTAKTVASALAKLGIEEFGKPGDIFDPTIHNAVMHTEDENAKEGEIVEVFQKGYRKGKRIIRFATVKTAN